MAKRVTIKDVAQYAGVSISVVSYVLNGAEKPVISEATRKRVFEAVKALGYVPNRTAATLRKGKSNTLGIISFWDHSFVYEHFLQGIMSAAKKLGYNTVICQADPETSELEYIRYYLDRMIDGVILILPIDRNTYDIKKHLDALIKHDVPFSAIGDPVDGYNENIINIDYASTALCACRYFAKKGYKKITYVAPRSVNFGDRDRMDGYLRASKELGFATDVCYMDEIEQKLPSIKAAVVYKSAGALTLLREAEKQGISIPRDLELIAANTEVYSEFVNPSLSTVVLPSREMGVAAAEKLISKIEGEETPNPVFPDCELRLLETTK